MLREQERQLISSSLIHRLEPLSLRARVVVEGFLAGLHRSPYHGFSVEFAEHRMYQAGDPLKHIDWKVFGRTDRFYIKQYQEETNLRANILVDMSRSMDFASCAVTTKAEYSRSLAAALIYMLIAQRDAVGLTLFDESPRRTLRPRSAPTWRRVLWRALENARPQGKTRLGSVLHLIADQIGRRGLVVLISDLLDEPEPILSGLHHLRHNGHEVIIFQVLDQREVDLDFPRESRFDDLESGASLTANPWQVRDAYREQVQLHIETLRRGCAHHRVAHHLLTTDTPLDEALMAFLAKRQRQG